MYFELQFSAAVFTRIIRNRLRALPLPLDLSLPDVDGTTLVVDQVVIAADTSIQREKVLDATGSPVPAASQTVWTFSPTNLTSFTVPYLQVKQEVSVLLVREADLDRNGSQASRPVRTITLYLVFNVSVAAERATQGGGPVTMSYTLAYVDFSAAGAGLDATLRAWVTQAVAGVQIAPTTVDFGALTKLTKRSVSAVNAGIACDQAATCVALRADFDVYDSPASIRRGFFEVGPQNLLGGGDWAMLVDAALLIREGERTVSQSLDAKANIRTLSAPKGVWDATAATLRIGTDVRLLGACPNFIDDTDIDARVQLAVRWSVDPSKPDAVVTDYRLDHTKTDLGQLFGCALTGALLFPFMGTALFLSDPGFSVTDYLGGIAFGPVVSLANLVGFIDDRKMTDDISTSLDGTCHKVDDENYACTTAVPIVMQLSPHRNSRLSIVSASGVPEGLVLSGPVVNLPEADDGEVGAIAMSQFRWQVLGTCTGNGKNNFTIGIQARVLVPLTAPAALAVVRLLPPSAGYAVVVNGNDIVVTPTTTPPPNHSCRIRLVTGRGVRTLTLRPARPLGEDEAATLQTDLLGQASQCYYNERQYTQIEKIGWRVDPPYRDLVDAVAGWQILVKGAAPTDELVVIGPAGQRLATARPAATGTIHVSFMFAAADAPKELTLELERAEGEASRELEVATQQTLYERRATLSMTEVPKALRLGGTMTAPELLVETADWRQQWDTTTPSAPLLRGSTSIPRDEDPGAAQEPSSSQDRGREAPPQVAAGGLRTGLAGDEVGQPTLLGFRQTVAVRDDDGVTVYDMSDPRQPVPIQTFAGKAWFEGTAVGPNAMATYDDQSNAVHLYAVAGTYNPV